jgi:hypothetical protein
MKKVLILCAAMTVIASSAFAVGGIDVSINACPGNTGAVGDVVPIDCAGGAGVVLLGTWGPAEDIVGLTNLDGIWDLYVGAGLANAGFWNFDAAGCNSLALNSSQARPTAGCATPVAYTACWSLAGSGTAIAAGQTSANTVRMPFTCYRPGLLNVTAGQKLFGVQIIVDGSNATEAGGSCDGCSQPVSVAWNEATPGAAAGAAAPSALSSPTGNFPGFGQCMGVTNSPNCAAVPTKKRTWGQLKSLYR